MSQFYTILIIFIHGVIPLETVFQLKTYFARVENIPTRRKFPFEFVYLLQYKFYSVESSEIV